MRRRLLAILLLLPLAACTALPTPRPSAESDEDLDELKRRVIELQQQMAVNEVEMARLKERLTELGGRPVPQRSTEGTTSRPAPPAASPPADARDRAGSDERPAERGRSSSREVSEEDVEFAPVPVEPGRVPPPSSAEEREPQTPTVEGGEAPADPPAAVSGEAAEPVSPEARALYDEGFTHFHEGRYVDAETTFQSYLQRHPHTELADNASFWIGEARLQRQDVRGALSAFRQTVQRYPEGNKIPDALLKAGECLQSLGDVESARLSYQEIVERFPNTAASEVARARMARLGER